VNRSIHPCTPAADAAHLSLIDAMVAARKVELAAGRTVLHDAADATLQAVRDAFDRYHDAGAVEADGDVLRALRTARGAYERAGGVS
jgi:hypothetical protein